MNLSQMHKFLNEKLSRSECDTLAFNIGVNPENISGHGTNKSAFLLNLVQHCDRHRTIDGLIKSAKSINPSISFDGDVFESSESESMPFDMPDIKDPDEELRDSIIHGLETKRPDSIYQALIYLMKRL